MGPGELSVGQGPASPLPLAGARAWQPACAPVERRDLPGAAMKKCERVEQLGRGMNGSREEVGLFCRIPLSCSVFAVVCCKDLYEESGGQTGQGRGRE